MAGGASRRFGSDKALALIGAETVLARMCKLIQASTGNVRIVAPRGRYVDSGFEIVEDRWPDEGPLGGIITAMSASAKDGKACGWNLMVSCDMPFLTQDWLTFLSVRASASLADVVVPHSAYGLEPLCACWKTTALEVLQAAFDEGTRKVTEGMKRLRMEILDETHWKRFDSAGQLFWNMNTPQDYEAAVRASEAGHQ
jgi:molybdopterin-guanine dinucleotide biosynthesis protein A